jgi:uncharacterized protein (DUF2147 family)
MQAACSEEIRMKARLAFTLPLLTALLAPAASHAQTAGTPIGVWLTQAADARVRISKCGEAICGVVVWLREPVNPATGQPMVDDKNPNPALAKRPMIGLPLFTDMRIAGPNKWSGHIYNADDGGTYASNISVTGPDTLRVEGCVGMLCGSESWRRFGH